MVRTAANRIAQRATRNASSRLSMRSYNLTNRTTSSVFNASRSTITYGTRHLSSTPSFRIVPLPETSDPKPKERESMDTASSTSKVEVSEERNHQFSESYMNNLLEKLEALQEEREDVDVEYSVCYCCGYA